MNYDVNTLTKRGLPVPKCNGAAVDPTVNDDDTQNFEVGDRWVNTTSDEEFVVLDVSTGAAVWKSTTAAGGGGGMPYSAEVDGDSLVTTTSTTYVSISGMSITPPSGTYIAFASLQARSTSSNGIVFFALFTDSTEHIVSKRQMEGTDEIAVPLMTKITVNGSQAINIRVKKSGIGDGEVRERSLVLIEVAP